jgi:hypothetical protein
VTAQSSQLLQSASEQTSLEAGTQLEKGGEPSIPPLSGSSNLSVNEGMSRRIPAASYTARAGAREASGLHLVGADKETA